MTHTSDNHPVRQGFAGGTTFAAAVLLLTAALLGLFQGIAAAANDDLIVVGPQYTYQLDLTTWGWIHIIAALIGVLIAVGLFTGATWARAAAVVIAAVSIVVNFLWLPYYPWWSILVIALDIVVIWAVTTWRSE
ncbi:hypothetical protein M1C59_14410 [Gordonia terrae]|uniref:DUF7144 family membrane protein n=1 Tax=Gordonia terrae TaxID=2055 RepID=UPI00200B74BF|nr:hypothetical protein [Gordonia terrae]UPW07278.1 hypothetical protein M1C59_14410 [Gordonia terrae]